MSWENAPWNQPSLEMCSAYHNYTRLHFTIFNDARCFLPDNMILLEFKMFMGERSDAFLHATNGNSRNGKNVFFVPVTISSRIVFKYLYLLTYATNFPNFLERRYEKTNSQNSKRWNNKHTWTITAKIDFHFMAFVSFSCNLFKLSQKLLIEHIYWTHSTFWLVELI